jgi:hypothetical protein
MLWQALRQQSNQRILLVAGVQGVGKTYLLGEYKAECAAEGVVCIQIDFADSANHTYLGLIRLVRNEFPSDDFAHLDEIIRQTRNLGRWESVPPAVLAPVASLPSLRPEQPGARSGGVDFAAPAEVGRDVAGRDINYIFQIIQRDDPVVQAEVQDRITGAFLECLAAYTTTQPIAFLFDSWELAPTAIRDWINARLLLWILERRLPVSIAVIAGSQLPDFRRTPRRIQQLTLQHLSEEEVRIYWVEKRGLPPEDVAQVFRLTRGLPGAVALLADVQTLPAPVSA